MLKPAVDRAAASSAGPARPAAVVELAVALGGRALDLALVVEAGVGRTGRLRVTVLPISDGSARTCFSSWKPRSLETSSMTLPAASPTSSSLLAELASTARRPAGRSWRPGDVAPCRPGRVQIDRHADLVVDEGRVALQDDAAEQDRQEAQRRCTIASTAVEPEARLLGMARLQAAPRPRRGRGVRRCGRAVGRTASVILFPVLLDDPQGDDVQRQGDARTGSGPGRRPTGSWDCRTPGRRSAG